MKELNLERKKQELGGIIGCGTLMVTPPLGENYWSYRVQLSEKQAVLGFPKFNTLAIGFAVEDEDWNTNLSFVRDAEVIARHIAVNKGDDSIDDADVVAAIRLIQEAVKADA